MARAYYEEHHDKIESTLSAVMRECMEQQPTEPLSFISRCIRQTIAYHPSKQNSSNNLTRGLSDAQAMDFRPTFRPTTPHNHRLQTRRDSTHSNGRSTAGSDGGRYPSLLQQMSNNMRRGSEAESEAGSYGGSFLSQHSVIEGGSCSGYLLTLGEFLGPPRPHDWREEWVELNELTAHLLGWDKVPPVGRPVCTALTWRRPSHVAFALARTEATSGARILRPRGRRR